MLKYLKLQGRTQSAVETEHDVSVHMIDNGANDRRLDHANHDVRLSLERETM